MTDNNEEIIRLEDSKCNTCKFGLCLKEKDIKSLFQPTTISGNDFDGEPEQQGMTHVTFPIDGVRSVCFWRPKGMESGMIAPLVFNCVTECSKYAKD